MTVGAESAAAQFSARVAAVRARITSSGADALVVTHQPNIRYLSGHSGSAGILVVSHDALALLLDGRYREAARRLLEEGLAPDGLEVVDVPASYDSATLAYVGERHLRRVAVEGDYLPVGRFRWFERMAAGDGRTGPLWQPVAGLVEGVRTVKDVAEQESLRRSARGLTAVAEAAFRFVREGVTERDVAGVIEAAMRASGFEKPAFDTIVASGPNGALPHYRAGDRKLASGDLVVLDFGGVMDGYCSDITRTVALGPPGMEARRVYGAVLRAQQAAIGQVAPGRTAEEIDAAARAVLAADGLGEAFSHGTGHGIGLEVHEAPRVGRAVEGSAPAELMAGMVFTVEPGAYLPGWGGVRIEDDVMVTGVGCEVLTDVPRELLVL